MRQDTSSNRPISEINLQPAFDDASFINQEDGRSQDINLESVTNQKNSTPSTYDGPKSLLAMRNRMHENSSTTKDFLPTDNKSDNVLLEISGDNSDPCDIKRPWSVLRGQDNISEGKAKTESLENDQMMNTAGFGIMGDQLNNTESLSAIETTEKKDTKKKPINNYRFSKNSLGSRSQKVESLKDVSFKKTTKPGFDSVGQTDRSNYAPNLPHTTSGDVKFVESTLHSPPPHPAPSHQPKPHNSLKLIPAQPNPNPNPTPTPLQPTSKKASQSSLTLRDSQKIPIGRSSSGLIITDID